jgi:GTP-binding protein Era
MTRCGVVAVVGRPNVGKSTLVNALVGAKVAIVSAVPNTTRRDVRGVWTSDEVQLVFVDTPGFHKPRTALGARLNDLVGGAVAGVDAIVQVVDAAAGVGRGDAYVHERQVAGRAPLTVCAVNKADLVGRRIVPQLAAAAELGSFDEVVPISARDGDGVATLRNLLVAAAPQGSFLFPEDARSDQPFEERVAETIREQAIGLARQELPHSIAVTVDEVEDEDGGLLRIHASLVVERESQKPILVGSGGEIVRLIGTRARQEIEAFTGRRVFLDLRVRVLKDWQRDPKSLDRLGY